MKKKLAEVRIEVVTKLANKIFEDVDEVNKETEGIVTVAEVIHALGYYLFESGKMIESEARASKEMRGFVLGGGAG